MKKICTVSGKEFEITQKDLDFYEKMGVTIPTLCPEERQRRRLSWQNMRNLYHRKCDATGKKLISNYSEDKIFPVFEKSYWFSDKHNFLDYGQDFDFSKPFFEQFKDLQNKVPRFSIQQQEPMENSEYCNFASNCKNCYLLFDSDFCEDALFGQVMKKSQDCVDSAYTSNSELCYECIDSENCFELRYSRNCVNCSSSWFLKNCIGCQNCFGCVNLRNKEYYFLNKKMSKEAYETKIKNLKLNSYLNLQNLSNEFKKFILSFPNKKLEGIQNENISGNHISHSKNAYQCFNVKNSWDISFCDSINKAKNCYDVSSFGEDIELIYEGVTIGLSTQNCLFCFTAVQGSSDLTYCDTAYTSQDCFGCVGIQRGKYCILNKQYTKEEYFILREKIITHMKKTGEWGEFFPMKLSPFGYNETVAQEYFPLEKPVGAITNRPSLKYNWKTEETSAQYSGLKVEIPDNISDINEDICEKILTCESTGKNYRIVKPELKFYKKMNLPIPRICPDERHKRRMALRNPRKLWERKCDNPRCKDKLQFVSTFSLDRPEKVFCEKCYLETVD